MCKIDGRKEIWDRRQLGHFQQSFWEMMRSELGRSFKVRGEG